ncbi:MAG: universal stress protein [Paracoccaceae bacterium]|jgi:nucleotide-binding universal stress UspA family protein
MYNNILIPIALDHEVDVNDIITVARRLRSEGGKITLVTVVEPVPSYVVEYVTINPKSVVQGEVRKRLEMIAKDYQDLELAVTAGKPGVAIAEMAEKDSVDLILIGSHRPGVADYFLGSTASRVVRRATCTVMVLR